MAKLRLITQLKNKVPTIYVDKLNIESINDPIVKNLYEKRLTQIITEQPILDQDDVEASWEKVKLHIDTAANEALGKRRINKNSNKFNTPWFSPGVKQMAREKRETYLRYLNNRTPEEWIRYKEMRNRVQAEIRRIKTEYWETFIADM